MQTANIREFVSNHPRMTDESHIIVGDRPVGVHCKLRLLVFLGLIGWLAFIGLAVVVTKTWELL